MVTGRVTQVTISERWRCVSSKLSLERAGGGKRGKAEESAARQGHVTSKENRRGVDEFPIRQLSRWRRSAGKTR